MEMNSEQAEQLLKTLETAVDLAAERFSQTIHPMLRDEEIRSVIRRVAENPAELPIMLLMDELSDEDARTVVHMVFATVHFFLLQNTAELDLKNFRRRIAEAAD